MMRLEPCLSMKRTTSVVFHLRASFLYDLSPTLIIGPRAIKRHTHTPLPHLNYIRC